MLAPTLMWNEIWFLDSLAGPPFGGPVFFQLIRSMVEQSHAGESHDQILLIALGDDQIIPDGAAGLGNILDAGGKATLHGVGEGEEYVGAQGGRSGW